MSINPADCPDINGYEIQLFDRLYESNMSFEDIASRWGLSVKCLKANHDHVVAKIARHLKISDDKALLGIKSYYTCYPGKSNPDSKRVYGRWRRFTR